MDIIVKNINKAFYKKPVLQNISFMIPSGDMICLLGPSGSGKTTAIRLLIGAISADSGEVFIGNTKMPDLKLMRKIGFMPQNDALYEDLTGEKNLLFLQSLTA